MQVLMLDNVTIPVPGQRNDERRLLNNASINVRTGEILSIIGPNGAGKSSLLKAVSGELAYDGQILFTGIPNNPRDRARHFAYLPQQSTLSFPFTVSEVVELGRLPHSTGKQRDMEMVSESLRMMDIEYLAARRYTLLSGGEKQRVQLARVLCQIWESPSESSPRLLLLDEPTAALDLGHQHHLMQALQTIKGENIAIMMVMHDINLAARYSDKMLALLCSEQVAFGPPPSVVNERIIEHLFGIPVEIIQSPENGLPIVLGK